MSKNIVICCDGTNNEIAGDETNVLRLFRTLIRSGEQAVFYDAGVGTNVDPTALWPWRRMVRKRLDGAIGLSIRQNVLDAYRFLSNSYEDGDHIFLFGFSRGAYTVRALAGMMYRCGLLSPWADNLAAYAWSVYSDEDRSGDGARQFGGAARIKKVFGREVPIHYLGVWDTVSTFGWVWDLMTVPNTDKMPEVEHVRQALALDEKRSCFQPCRVTPQPNQDCKEVWFAGVHADIGGGYPEEDAGLAAISLYWMISEAVTLGLRIDYIEAERHLKALRGTAVPCALAPAHDESSRFLWRLQGWFPKRGFDPERKSRNGKGKFSWSWPNWAAKRSFRATGEYVHESVQYRLEKASPKYIANMPSEFTYVPTTPIDQLPWNHSA